MAINQDITNLPTPPNRSDSPSDFSDKADTFLAALPQLQTELNLYADEANTTQTAINTSETNAATSETNAEDWASKTTGLVLTTDYSAKAYAVGGTGVTDVTGAAKEWAVKTGTTVDGSDYSAKDYAISVDTITDGSAKEWAVNTGGTVDATEYSSKDYASSQNLISTGSSKDWAIKTGSTVDGTEFSAKKYASDAEASASAAAATAGATAWSAGTTYDTNDAAIGSDGNTYRSLVDGNLGNDPVTDGGTNWLNLTDSISEQEVRDLFSASGDLTYNSSTGVFSVETPDLVLTPENISPADGATGALFTPELEGSSYGSLYGVPMASARWQINTTSTFPEPTTETKTITVASGTLYEGGGSTGNVFYVDGAENPALTLQRGSTYVFDQSDASNTGHPLRIQTTGDVQYTDGVTVEGTPGSAGAKTIFVVPLDAPTDLEYYCTVHGLGMGGPITTEALTDVEDTLVTGTATTYTTESLSPDSQFFWRVQYADTDGVTSDFSEATSFTTANIFTAQPTITAPADGATDIAEQPIIESSAFNTVNGSDTHVASQWEITRVSDSVVVFDSGEDTTNLTSIDVPAGVLDEGQESYTVKVRHKGQTFGFSAYSPDVTFTTSAVFFDPEDPQFIGQAFAGGFLVGVIDTVAGTIDSQDDYQTGERYALIVAPKSLEEPAPIVWDSQDRAGEAGSFTRWDGLSSTDSILAKNDTSYEAFEHIRSIRSSDPVPSDGGSDWYLPAMDELELIYRNLKPLTADNFTGNDTRTFPGSQDYGFNPSSDPTASAYTEGDPSQTSVTDFQDGGAEAVDLEVYWSSTDADDEFGRAWQQDFAGSDRESRQEANAKDDTGVSVRPVRRVPV